MTNPLISVVTGTYQRINYLKRAVDSVRRQMPRGLMYELVVVDGGSKDGTPEWCQSQPDIKFIQQGELRGAIAAFNEGCANAGGDYVLLLNDDVIMRPGSIVKAIAYLEAHPECGAVAVKDNRRAPGYDTDDYKVQTIQARRGRKMVNVPYPQVGIVRRWLGDLVKWWDIGDPQQHTYGGDAALGAKIWEQGYSIDPVDGVEVDDLVAPDSLRTTNAEIERQRGSAYYRVYPHGPQIPKEPQLDNPQAERLRVLYAPIFEPGYPQQKAGKRGLRDALAKVGFVYEWDYLGEPSPRLAERVRDWQPHLVLLQLHGVDRITEQDLAEARATAPDAVFVNWNGDVWTEHLTSAEMVSLLRHVDLQLVVNARVIDEYARRGIRAAYWQVAFEPVDDNALPAVTAHDVVFLANAYSPARKALGAMLASLPGVNVGLYGFGWRFPSGNTTYNFPATAALYRAAKIAIGDNQYPDETGFVSNRIFDALAAGAFLLHQRVPGLDELTRLQDGVHYVSWTDEADLQRQLRYWLDPTRDAERAQIAAAGQRFVRDFHSFDARVRELFDELLPMVEATGELA